MTNDSNLIGTDHPVPPPQRRVLDRLLDLMIPASDDGRLPSAGTLDLYADRGRLSDARLVVLCDGLRALDELAVEQHDAGFAALSREDATRLVEAYRGVAPGFFGVFVPQSAARYYQHDQVMAALGLDARPPWPEGNTVPDGNWSLLDPVRERADRLGPIYRG